MHQENDDFRGLEELGLTPRALESVKQARREARRIIDDLDPFHVWGWHDLIRILEDSLKTARMRKQIFTKNF